MGVGALESPDVGEHSRLDTLGDFVEPLENFLEDFEAKTSQQENVFSLHEIGFLTLFFKKKSYFFTFASLKKDCGVSRPWTDMVRSKSWV